MVEMKMKMKSEELGKTSWKKYIVAGYKKRK